MALVSFLMRSFRAISCLVVILVLLAGCNTPAETQVLVVKETVEVTAPPVVKVTPAVMEATSTGEFALTSFTSPSGAISFLHPSAFDSCQEGEGSSSATWQASCQTTPPQRLLLAVVSRMSDGPVTDAIWDDWVQLRARSMENPVAFQAQGRQVDVQI